MGPQRSGRLIRRCLALLFVLVGASAPHAQLLPPGALQSKLLAYRRGAVRISPQFVTGELAQGGWGVIVGDSGDALTIVTPCHVVCDQPDDQKRLTDTPAVLLEGMSQPVKARRQTTRVPGADVAVLTAAKPISFTTIPLPIVDLHDLSPLMDVWKLGGTEGWQLGGPGHYQDKSGPSDQLRITELPAPSGSSGSLVLNDYGVLGIVISQSGLGGNTYVLPGSRIAELVESAGFNANLLRSAAPPPPPPPPDDNINNLVVGPGISTPTLPVAPSEWQTVHSTSYPTPSSRTTLILSGTSGAGGPATLDDTKLGHAEGSYKQQGWAISFTSPNLCGAGEMHSDTRTGLNIMNFQLTPLYCGNGRGNCACGSFGVVQSSGLTTYETLVQTGRNAPTMRSDAPPPPPDYRSPSDLSGETWVFPFGGHSIQVDFAADGTATFSSPVFGSSGRWERNGREYITIMTPSYTIKGTLSGSSGSMVINIGRQGSFEAVASGLTMRRVSEPAASGGTRPSYVLAAPDMQPAAHLAGHKLAFDVGGPPLVVTFLPGPDHEATLSNARYGATGTWASISSIGFTVKTVSHGVTGWFTQNGSGEVIGCSAIIRPLYGTNPPGQVITCRRVE